MKFLIIMALIVPLSLRAENIVLPQNAELQWRVCETSLRTVVNKLRLNTRKTKTRKVYLWDTIDGDLMNSNWTIRARDTGKKFSYSAKRNFYRPDYHAPKGSECELDMKENAEKVGCSLKIKTKTFVLPQEFMTTLQSDDSISEHLTRARFWGPAKSTNIEFENGAELELIHFQNFYRIEFSIRVPSKTRFKEWEYWDQRLKSQAIKLCPSDLQLGSIELLREFTANSLQDE